MTCAAINDDNGKAGFGESAFAEADYLQSTSGLSGTALLQQVYQFRAVKAALSFWRVCVRSLSDAQG
jgi:hypothetical protein